MRISKIVIENYRGIKDRQEIPLGDLTSIVGKNDAGKSIILNAIASFLDISKYPISKDDFYDKNKKIVFEFHFMDGDLKEKLMDNIKLKKNEGKEEYLKDLLFDNSIIIKKIINKPQKKFDEELICIKDYTEDKLSNLYEKNDEGLSKILREYNIEIPIEGVGRNSKLEKIKYIKKYCEQNDIMQLDKFIEDKYKIVTLLPQVELFNSDYGLIADTSFRSSSVSEIKDYFDREKEKYDRLEEEISSEMNVEADAIKKYMSDYSSIEKIEINPSFEWKKSIPSVDVSFKFQEDTACIPMSHKGTGCRRLFMVARFRYLANKNKGENIIYLIEEPETYLHPSAQEDLLNALKILSEDKQVVITTHSPVFAGATNMGSIILCKKNGGSIYEYNKQKEGDSTFLHKIIDELGIKPSFNLRDEFEIILFVEGHKDIDFYKLISKNLLGKEFDNKILILPCGGSSVDYFVNIEYFKKNGRKLYLILDSDKGCKCSNKKELNKKMYDNFNDGIGKAYLLKKSTIENYLHPEAIKRKYPKLNDVKIDIFKDDELVKIFFDKYNKEYKTSKKHNIEIFELMTKDEWKEVVEQELIDFLGLILN